MKTSTGKATDGSRPGPPWLRWVVGSSIGVALAAAAVWYVYPRYYSPEVEAARVAGYDPPILFETRDLQRKAWRNGTLSPAELARLKTLTGDSNMFIRARAVWALGQVRNPLERSAAIAAVHAKLNDPAWLVRQFALRALKRLKDPELGVVARRMTQDPDENVRELARELLEEDGRR